MDRIMALLTPYFPYAVLVSLLFAAVLLLLTLSLRAEVRRLDSRLKRLAGTGDGQELAAALERFRDIKEVKDTVERMEEKVADIIQYLEGTLCRVGMVRFNAFPDTGSELSFALAVLSKGGDGFILTSLYARDETRIFLKPVKRAKALYRLSEEEEKALEIALGLVTE
ncbi:MAG: DUF4446 family protein [Thermoanaerobacteraceae bacterium]|nr:DUF4446 family protein [Thermoanaerobacteraceae bacterium]